MRVILEGVDASGKSTLASKLIKDYDLSMIHSGGKAANDLTYYTNLLTRLDNVILDRAHISEVVFSKIYNRPERLSFDDVMAINKMIVDNNDILVIMFSSDLDILRQRFIQRGELNYLNEVEDQYNEFLRWIYVLNAYFDDYPYYKVVDISQPDAYEKLYIWVDKTIKEINITKVENVDKA